jgi:pantetheine-phosphate adenylyltransferase
MKVFEFVEQEKGYLRITYKDILLKYGESHRFYHNIDHIINLFSKVKEYDRLLYYSILFHDIIYNVGSKTNEEDSANFFKNSISDKWDEPDISIVYDAILSTKTHEIYEGITPTAMQMVLLDMEDLFSNNLSLLLENEYKIFREYQMYDYIDYTNGRIKFLTDTNNSLETSNIGIEFLINYIKHRNVSIGVYPGSFDPFHKGHYDILTKAEKIFDKVIIMVGKNPSKGNRVNELPESIKNRQIIYYDGLLTDAIKNLPYEVILVRGLRNQNDFQNELTQTQYLTDLLPSLKTINIFSDIKYQHISSSSINQLELYGVDTSKYKL